MGMHAAFHDADTSQRYQTFCWNNNNYNNMSSQICIGNCAWRVQMRLNCTCTQMKRKTSINYHVLVATSVSRFAFNRLTYEYHDTSAAWTAINVRIFICIYATSSMFNPMSQMSISTCCYSFLFLMLTELFLLLFYISHTCSTIYLFENFRADVYVIAIALSSLHSCELEKQSLESLKPAGIAINNVRNGRAVSILTNFI